MQKTVLSRLYVLRISADSRDNGLFIGNFINVFTSHYIEKHMIKLGNKVYMVVGANEFEAFLWSCQTNEL